MNKINGWTQEEAIGFIEYVYEGRKAGRALSELFEIYGIEHCRAASSVRNYYYAFLKKQKSDDRVKRILEGKWLLTGTNKPFTEET